MLLNVSFNGEKFEFSISMNISIDGLIGCIKKWKKLKDDTREFHIEYQGRRISGDSKFMAVLEDKAEIILVAVHPEPAPRLTISSQGKAPLIRLIEVYVDGQCCTKFAEGISIQPIFVVIVKNSIAKNINAFLKRNATGAPIPECIQRRSTSNGRFEFQMNPTLYLDYDTEYSLVVCAKVSDLLEGNRTLIGFRTAKQVVFEEGQIVEITHADVRLMSNNFDKSRKNLENQATGQLGAGAFGTVFKSLAVFLSFKSAVDVNVQDGIKVCRVAIKRMTVSDSSKVRDVLGTVQRELAVLRDPDFCHPNIVRLLAYVSASKNLRSESSCDTQENQDKRLFNIMHHFDRFPCLVYEYLPLGSLDVLLRCPERAADLTWKLRLSIMMGIAYGLRHLHTFKPDMPAYHRDIKSANVALDSDCTPKLIDWGLSRYHAEPNIIGGTEGYICPYYRKTGIYGAVSDIFSFGIVMLEIISGRLQSKTYDGRYAVMQHLNNYREFADQNRRPCPEQVVTKLMRIAIKCTADKIEERFQSMSEVIADLLVVEKENVVLEHFEQETEKRIMQLQDQLENLSLQRDLQNRIRFMCNVYNRIEESANMKICCYEGCRSETPLVPADEGITCPFIATHFYCRDCFSTFVDDQLGNESALRDNEFQLLCQECLCLPESWKTPYSIHVIAKHSKEEVFCRYLETRENAKVHAEVILRQNMMDVQRINLETEHQNELNKRIREDEDKYLRDVTQLTKQVERLAQEEEQRIAKEMRERAEQERREAEERRIREEAQRHKNRIETDILKMHCPHCKGVMVENSELLRQCMSWHHTGERGCNKFCCGLCLAPFPDSGQCHNHVKSCPLNPCQGQYHVGNEEQRLNARAPRRKADIEKYFGDFIPDAVVRGRTSELLVPALQRLRVTL